MIRSIGVFLSFCLASTLLRIPPFGLNNIQEFMIYIMGLTAFCLRPGQSPQAIFSCPVQGRPAIENEMHRHMLKQR